MPLLRHFGHAASTLIPVTSWSQHGCSTSCIPSAFQEKIRTREKAKGRWQKVSPLLMNFARHPIQQFLLTSHWPERYHKPPWVQEGLECISFWPGTLITSPATIATQVLLVRRMGTVDIGGVIWQRVTAATFSRGQTKVNIS